VGLDKKSLGDWGEKPGRQSADRSVMTKKKTIIWMKRNRKSAMHIHMFRSGNGEIWDGWMDEWMRCNTILMEILSFHGDFAGGKEDF
jgi:hypothetical protein